MSHTSSASFETECNRILEAIVALPPFRRGTVTAHPRTCGKPACRCASSVEHRHESYQWTATIHGKKFHKTLHLGPEVAKFLNETAAFRQFKELVEQFIALSEQRADQTPLVQPTSENDLDVLKNKLRKQLSKPSARKSAR